MKGIDTLMAEATAQGRGDHPALLFDDGSTLTYSQLEAQVVAAADEFSALGLAAGERVALIGENSGDMVVALFAVMRSGAWAVPLNPRMSAAEIDAICAHCEPRLVYLSTASSAEAEAHAQRLGAAAVQASLPQGRLHRSELPGAQADPAATGDGDPVALMIYTSGSTGTPKGVMLTHANLRFVTGRSLHQEVLLPDDVLFHALPISHSFGLITALLGALRAGASIRLVRRFSAQGLGAAIASGGVNVVMGVPAMYARLHDWVHDSAQQQGRPLTPNRLRLAYIGGSLIDATRKAQTEALLGIRLHHGYGLSESSPIAARTIGHPPPSEVTAGWPVPGIELEVQDAHGRSLPAGQPGEVCIRGQNVMKGYFRDPAQTADAIDARGWLHTGDIGCFGPAGDLSIVGRIKEMIIRGGFNVYPAEVEKAIAAFPDVAQCAVVGCAAGGDEEIVAYIEPAAGRPIDTRALGSFLRGRLAPYKLPSRLIVLEQLPASSTGKLLKAQLKTMAAASAAADRERS